MLDVNGTRHHALLGEDFAGAGLEQGALPAAAAYDPDHAELTLRPDLFHFPRHAHDRDATAEDRRGVGADRFGNVYAIDTSPLSLSAQLSGDGSTVRYWPTGTGETDPKLPVKPGASFGPVPDPSRPVPEPCVFAGATVTSEHYLVCGVLDRPGLRVFDLRAGGPPREARWPAGIAFVPWAIASRPDGAIAVLDRANARLWLLDRTFAIVRLAGATSQPPAPPGSFAPELGGGPTHVGARAVSLADAIALPGYPVGVACLPDGTVLVLDRGDGSAPSHVLACRDGTIGERLALSGTDVAVAAQDIAVGPAPAVSAPGVLATLYAAATQGDQAYAFTVRTTAAGGLELVLQQVYLPMRRYTGRGLVCGQDGVARYDADGHWTELQAVCRPRHAALADVISVSLDGREPGCVWHRVVVDADIPSSCAVRISIRAADDAAALSATEWEDEPALVRRPTGTEVAWQHWADSPDYASWETLVQAAVGRHAQIRIRLLGDGRVTPRVRAVRLWYPRFSYLQRYLPHAYREDPESASFLDRFLANTEGMNTALEDRIATFQALLDPRAMPADALDWLARWFDLALDPAWDEPRRRLLLRHAMEFLARRGTPGGLQIALRLAFDTNAGEDLFSNPGALATQAYRIVERFRLRPGDCRCERRAAASTGPDGWAAFLQRRYGSIGALMAAYGWAGASAVATFADVAYPSDVPAEETARHDDWCDFNCTVLPMRDAAHRFTVLLPVCVDDDDPEPVEVIEARARALAERVVEAQRPAHTVFDIRFYWSAFQIGQARLGFETVLDAGNRSSRLLSPAALGLSHLGESTLGGDPQPFLGRGRTVGRDRLHR